MKKLLGLIINLFLFTSITPAQSQAPVKTDTAKITAPSTNQTEQFRNNDSAFRKLNLIHSITADQLDSTELALKSCTFEPGANAMIMQDLGVFIFGGSKIGLTRYRRIKIFNDEGNSAANIKIEYNNRFGAEHILAIVAQTINIVNGKLVRTRLDSTLIYNQHTNKQKDAIIFTMPNVKAGSLIEYSYVWVRDASWNLPDWDFQNELPTKNSEVNVLLANRYINLTQLTFTNKPFKIDSITSIFNGYGHMWSMEDVPSSKDEPYMRSANDELQRISFIVKSTQGFYLVQNIADSWNSVGVQLAGDKEFYKPFEQNISDADDIISKAKALKTNDEKIEYLFNQVKNAMRVDVENTNWFSKDGIRSAWKKKVANAAEINMVLCHLLNLCDVNAYPLLVSTRDNGLIYNNFPNIYQVNKIVAYVPVDSTKNYVLDASDKYGFYNQKPYELLNSAGICIDRKDNKYYTVYIKADEPSRKRITIDAEINPDGTLNGTALINCNSYEKSAFMAMHKMLDEEKYKEFLTGDDNNLKIDSLIFENADVDSLPLLQTIKFKFNLSVTDNNYIYFSPNIFSQLKDNPFINKSRASDIDFGSKILYSIAGKFKIPAGYKSYILPPSLTIVTPGKSITFQRAVFEQDGYIMSRYVISYSKAVYSKTDYPYLFMFYKKMYEMLNEQIVLKKS